MNTKKFPENIATNKRAQYSHLNPCYVPSSSTRKKNLQSMKYCDKVQVEHVRLIKHRNLKMYGGIKVYFHTFLTSECGEVYG